MKKLLRNFRKPHIKSTMESAGISTDAGFLSWEGNQSELCAKQRTFEDGNVERERMIKVGFVCNAGFGSSAMGATLFRRRLQELGISGVDVKAYSLDQIPEDLNLAVCQKDFQKMTGAELKAERVCTVGNLLNQSEYTQIARDITELMEEG